MRHKIMKKWIGLLVFCAGMFFTAGCTGEKDIKTDGYQYLIGVSLTNVMEPWLNNLVHVISREAEAGEDVNLIFRDAAGSTEKQAEDIRALMEYGIDLLILSPENSDSLNGVVGEVFEKIPIVVLGVEPGTKAYTSAIQADDEKIGKMAGEYILSRIYEPGDKVVVMEGIKDSPISQRRLRGFREAVGEHIPKEQITYYYGEWLRDVAEQRMKDFVVANGQADIIFAFNDEMAYGTYLACEQLRVRDLAGFIGVDGFEGEVAGLNLVERGILDATIQSPDFGALAYDTALDILEGKEVQRDIVVVPKLIQSENPK